MALRGTSHGTSINRINHASWRPNRLSDCRSKLNVHVPHLRKPISSIPPSKALQGKASYPVVMKETVSRIEIPSFGTPLIIPKANLSQKPSRESSKQKLSFEEYQEKFLISFELYKQKFSANFDLAILEKGYARYCNAAYQGYQQKEEQSRPIVIL